VANGIRLRKIFRRTISKKTFSLSLESIIRLGPVQPCGVVFKVTNVLARDRLKALKFQGLVAFQFLA